MWTAVPQGRPAGHALLLPVPPTRPSRGLSMLAGLCTPQPQGTLVPWDLGLEQRASSCPQPLWRAPVPARRVGEPEAPPRSWEGTVHQEVLGSTVVKGAAGLQCPCGSQRSQAWSAGRPSASPHHSQGLRCGHLFSQEPGTEARPRPCPEMEVTAHSDFGGRSQCLEKKAVTCAEKNQVTAHGPTPRTLRTPGAFLPVDSLLVNSLCLDACSL